MKRRFRHDLIVSPSGAWFRGRHLPCRIGRAGVTRDKCEGDLATPVAELSITRILYRPDRIRRPAPWAEPIPFRALWSDDPGDPLYNQMVSAPHRHSHEKLRRADPMYDLVLVTDWNTAPAVPGRGSAIFVHQLRREWAPTAGCIAFRKHDLLKIAGAIYPGATCIIRYP